MGDFGIDRLVEMLEQRFGRIGRPAGTLLIALLGLAAASWAVHTVIEFVIVPGASMAASAVSYVSGFHIPRPAQPLTLIDGLALLGGIVLTGGTWLLWKTEDSIDELHKQHIRDLEAHIERLETALAEQKTQRRLDAVQRDILQSDRGRDSQKESSGKGPSGELVGD